MGCNGEEKRENCLSFGLGSWGNFFVKVVGSRSRDYIGFVFMGWWDG